MDLNKKHKTFYIKSLIAFSAFIMLLFGGVVFYQSFKEYDNATQQGKNDAARLAAILSDQIDLSIAGVDTTLQRGIDRQYTNMLFGGNLAGDMAHNFKVWVEQSPQLAAMMMINEKGAIEIAVHAHTYEGWTDYRKSLANSDPFVTLEQNPDMETYIGTHFDRNSKFANLIIIARRINKLDGSFGGIMLAAIPPTYFMDFFRSIDVGNSRDLNLMMKNGYNFMQDIPQNGKLQTPIVNHILADISNTNDKLASAKNNGTFIEKVEDSQKIVAFKRSARFPLITSIMVDEQEFLENFWHERKKDLSFLAVFMIFGSALSVFALTLARQIIRIEESEAAAILASQAKSEFLANMSHELRTPLNAIIGFSEMMNSGYFGPLNAKQKERMQDINLCGTHLLQLITDILEFSKGDAGKLEIVEEKVNVGDIISETTRMLGDRIKAKEIQTTLNISPSLPLLFADRRKMKQILINLLSNAVKFTPQKGHILVDAFLEANGIMVLEVTDNGVGIAPEDIPKALSIFGQVHRSRSHEGTGLGLPLCRMFTELHGGKLTLTSQVGEGTKVRITFPAQRVITD